MELRVSQKPSQDSDSERETTFMVPFLTNRSTKNQVNPLDPRSEIRDFMVPFLTNKNANRFKNQKRPLKQDTIEIGSHIGKTFGVAIR